MSIIWEWVPNYSLGLIKLGDQISNYIENLQLLDDDEDDDDITGWKSYKLPNVDTYIYVENGLVVSVTSYEEFIYKKINLIGLNEDQLEELLDCKPSEIGTSVQYDNGTIETPLEYFNLGLQLWVDTKIVKSASILINR